MTVLASTRYTAVVQRNISEMLAPTLPKELQTIIFQYLQLTQEDQSKTSHELILGEWIRFQTDDTQQAIAMKLPLFQCASFGLKNPTFEMVCARIDQMFRNALDIPQTISRNIELPERAPEPFIGYDHYGTLSCSLQKIEVLFKGSLFPPFFAHMKSQQAILSSELFPPMISEPTLTFLIYKGALFCALVTKTDFFLPIARERRQDFPGKTGDFPCNYHVVKIETSEGIFFEAKYYIKQTMSASKK